LKFDNFRRLVVSGHRVCSDLRTSFYEGNKISLIS
jgi:hypothetical protein